MTVTDWLLDSDPALRWQVLRDLTSAPPAEVEAERARIAHEGWGARLLALRGSDGQWAGGSFFPADFRGDFTAGQPWTATLFSLALLRDLGVLAQDAALTETTRLVGENSRWDHDGQRFWDGEVEPCINGRTVAIGAYFGADVDSIVTRLISEQLADGGWNCEAQNGSVRSSFDTTINVLEGLLEYQRAGGQVADVDDARRRGEQYLLERNLFRRLRTGEVADAAWLDFAFPTYWHYDVLRGLEYFRSVGDPLDPRLREATEPLYSKRQRDGRWRLDHAHAGAVHFTLEGVGEPSRWVTLRALRVTRWCRPEASPGGSDSYLRSR